MATVAEEPVAAVIPVGVEPESNDVKAEETKPKKAAAPRKRSLSTHPPFLEMISEAIMTLKEKTGSSQYAIQKFMGRVGFGVRLMRSEELNFPVAEEMKEEEDEGEKDKKSLNTLDDPD